MKKYTKKQVSFDLDSTVLKAMFGEENYTRGWHDIQKFMEKNDFEHIEGSVYSSTKGMSNAEVLYAIKKLKSQYPYLKKAVRHIHQTEIGETYSLNSEFEYDGTPGIFAKENDNLEELAKQLLEDAAQSQTTSRTR